MRGIAMTDDDNTIDIIDMLPPVEVRKPWRQKLPDYYIKHIDELVALRKAITAMSSRLRHTHLRQLMEAVANDCGRDVHMQSVVGELEATLVLLKCAEERLWNAVPVEEFMTPGLLAEMRKKR